MHCLNEEQYKMVLRSSVGNVLQLVDNLKWAGQIIHHIILRIAGHLNKGNALWIEVGDGYGRLSLHEFALITGLKCVGSRTIVGEGG